MDTREARLQELLKASRHDNDILHKEIEKLKKQLNCKEVYSKYMPEDTEFVIMTKRDYERLFEEGKDE